MWALQLRYPGKALNAVPQKVIESLLLGSAKDGNTEARKYIMSQCQISDDLSIRSLLIWQMRCFRERFRVGISQS